MASSEGAPSTSGPEQAPVPTDPQEAARALQNRLKTDTFLKEMISEALCEKLGNKNKDGTCSFDDSLLTPAVFNKISITLAPNSMPSDPALL